MSRHTPHRSRAFFVTSTIALSVAFFAVAVGAWLISQGRLDSSADSIGVCTPASQATDTFNQEAEVYGSPLAVPTGWTADAGTMLRGYDRRSDIHDTSDAWMGINGGRISRTIRETRQGSMTFRLSSDRGYAGTESVTHAITLPTKSGTPLSLRVEVGTLKTPDGLFSLSGSLLYRDPLTNEYRSVESNEMFDFLGTPMSVPLAVMNQTPSGIPTDSDILFTINWDGTNFTIQSQFHGGFYGGTSNTSKSYRYAQNDATSITGLVLSTNSILPRTLMAKQITYPGGSAVPCVTGVSPASGVVGSQATITGSQLDDSLPGSPIAIVLNGTSYQTVRSGGSDSSITFTVPQVPVGTYNLGVTNAYGTSQQTTSFTVTAPPPPIDNRPTVTSITPNSGAAGSSAVLTGTNFTATGNRVLLTGPGTLRGVIIIDNLNTTNGSTTELGFTVPAGTGDGVYAVTMENANGSAAANNVNFTVTAGSSVVLAPTIAYITPTSGSTLGGTVVGVGGGNFVSGTTVKVGGVAATVSAVISGSITITTPPHAVGAVDVTVTNPDGQSATLPNAFVYTDLTTSSHGVTLTCAANDVGKQLTETFDSFADGQTKDFGWQVVTPEQTAITVRSTAGKTGKGLELADTNTTIGAGGVPYTVRSIKSSDQGSVSFDIQPKQTTGRFTTMLAGAKGTMMYVYLAPDGTLQAWNNAVTTGSQYVRIGNVTYTANEWANMKLDWNAQGVDVYWNGNKVNSTRLPYSYASNVAPVTSLSFNTGYESATNAFTGTYLIDNVVYPGCSSEISMTVNPVSGPMPLKVTASASVLSDKPFTWDFGDGSAKVTGTTRSVEHTYTKAGDFELSLTADGQTVKQTVKVTAVDPAVTAAVSAAASQAATSAGSVVGGGAAPAAPATKPASLVSTGGSLAVNLGIAFLLSVATGYFLLRRRHPGSPQ